MNGGDNWSKPATVPLPASQICTFDQPSQLPEANYAFRTKALPSLVSDGNRFYLIWARRTVDEFGIESCTRGRSRIAYLTTDGTSWDTTIRLVDAKQSITDSTDVLSHQFMPAAFAAGGVVEVSWYDTRDDQFYKDGAPLYSPYIVDEPSGGEVNRRHTADVYHAQITGGTASGPGSPQGSVKVSQYAVGNGGGDFPATADGRQLEFNYVNGRLFKQARPSADDRAHENRWWIGPESVKRRVGRCVACVLCGAGHNIRLLMKRLRLLWPEIMDWLSAELAGNRVNPFIMPA